MHNEVWGYREILPTFLNELAAAELNWHSLACFMLV